jgi:hypothetical protein
MTGNVTLDPWRLDCHWCDFYCLVFNRGMSGRDMGSGVEAAETMERHVTEQHGKTWREFLAVGRAA